MAGSVSGVQGLGVHGIRPSYDALLKQKISNCANWLSGLKPIKEKPDMALALMNFSRDLDILQNFKAFWLKAIKPDLKHPDKGPDYVAKNQIIQYGLPLHEFSIDDIGKFARYLMCFDDFVREPTPVDDGMGNIS
jgi:hypothetical protein